MTFYADGKFGVINRKWFGRPLTKGGDAASGIAVAGSGTTATKVKLYLPKGPIHMEKVGVQVIATLASAANATGSVNNQRLPIKFYKGTTSTLETNAAWICACGNGRWWQNGTLGHCLIDRVKPCVARSGSPVSILPFTRHPPTATMVLPMR